MKIVVLVIAHDDPKYIQMQNIWRSFMNTEPNIKCYFLKHSRDVVKTTICDTSQTIFVPGEDSLIPGVLTKTMAAVDFLLHSSIEFDYILRTNLSSVWIMSKLQQFVDTYQPEIACYPDPNPTMYSGAGLLFHRKWWSYLSENASKLNYQIPDDVEIGNAILRAPNCPPRFPLPRVTCDLGTNLSALLEQHPDVFHFRCKSAVFNHHEFDDIVANMSMVVNHVYPMISTFKYLCTAPSDINEHLPVLSNYAQECTSVFETGVRGCVSSWAFAHGLAHNGKERKLLIMNDLNECDTARLQKCASQMNISTKTIWMNNLHIPLDQVGPVDIVFIDTWHVYAQLKRELEKFSTIACKYIIMHDTTVDETYGEAIRMGQDIWQMIQMSGFVMEEICRGLWPAVEEFLSAHPEWKLHQRFTNNNGLTILKRMYF